MRPRPEVDLPWPSHRLQARPIPSPASPSSRPASRRSRLRARISPPSHRSRPRRASRSEPQHPPRPRSFAAAACASDSASARRSMASGSRSRRGETYGLLGPNGAGKTTTISMVCGILRRDEGEVAVAGRPMDPGATALKAEIGYVPQDLAIYPDLSARENLTFFGRLYGLGGAELRARVDDVLDDRRPGRARRGADGDLFGRDEAPPQHRHRPAPPAEPADPRRADGRASTRRAATRS